MLNESEKHKLRALNDCLTRERAWWLSAYGYSGELAQTAGSGLDRPVGHGGEVGPRQGLGIPACKHTTLKW